MQLSHTHDNVPRFLSLLWFLKHGVKLHTQRERERERERPQHPFFN